jgi:hypothetical protein
VAGHVLLWALAACVSASGCTLGFSGEEGKGMEVLGAVSPNGAFRAVITRNPGLETYSLTASAKAGTGFEDRYARDVTVLGLPERILVSDAGYVLELGFPQAFGNLALVLIAPEGRVLKGIGLAELQVDAADPELAITSQVEGLAWTRSALAYCVGDEFRIVFLDRRQVVIRPADHSVAMRSALLDERDLPGLPGENAKEIARKLGEQSYAERLGGVRFCRLFATTLPPATATLCKEVAAADEGQEYLTFPGGKPVKARKFLIREAAGVP